MDIEFITISVQIIIKIFSILLYIPIKTSNLEFHYKFL